MGGWNALGLLLLAPLAPAPGTPSPLADSRGDRNQALLFAGRVVQLAHQAADEYVRPVEVRELLEASLRGLYEEVGLVCPDETLMSVRRARTTSDYAEALATARMALGDSPALQGPRALFAAVNGFRHATDANTGLVGPRATTFVSIEMDCGIGLELEGVSGPRWTLYQVELGYATGRFQDDPAIGKVRQPSPPVAFPWRVRKVIPGSPCQKAGLHPGDVLAHLDGKEITAASSSGLFRDLVDGRAAYDPLQNRTERARRTFSIRRGGSAEARAISVKAEAYVPETVFGVQRLAEDQWNHVLDSEYRIGYVRVGSIESGTDIKVSEVLAGLAKKDCRALILDLRWCPGGFVDPGGRLAGLFLDEGAVVTRMTTRHANRGAPEVRAATPTGWAKYADRPLVVLVGPDTIGGGEMIASALQDHGRAIVLGQRTVGKGNVQSTPFPPFIGDLQFKISTGYSLRPDGKNRHRFPESQSTDDWGVRPDVGFEVPVTADLSAELRRGAELHALRPADNREALPFDDPARDPHRLMALRHLRKKLGSIDDSLKP